MFAWLFEPLAGCDLGQDEWISGFFQPTLWSKRQQRRLGPNLWLWRGLVSNMPRWDSHCSRCAVKNLRKKPEVTILPRFGVKRPSFLSCMMCDLEISNCKMFGWHWRGDLFCHNFCQGISTWFAFQIAIRHLDPASSVVPLAFPPGVKVSKGAEVTWFSHGFYSHPRNYASLVNMTPRDWTYTMALDLHE